MRAIRLAVLELRHVLTVRKMRLAVCVLALVPLLYGGLYLWAFWDPYSRLDSLPVAVVNLDQPATLDGRTIDAGAELVDELQESDTVKWQMVSAEEARQGLLDGSYQVSLTIPADFSKAIASASGDAPMRAELVVANQGTNILVSQITERILSEVRTAVSEKISATYLDNIYLGFAELHDGLETAADSAGQLAEGIDSAHSGATRLKDGLATAGSGAKGLADGLSRLSSGAQALTGGTDKISAGASTLAAKLSDASSGAQSIAAGASSAAGAGRQLAAGLTRLESSGATLTTSAAAVAAGAAQLREGVDGLESGAQQVTEAGARLQSEAHDLGSLLAALAAAHPEVTSDPTFAQIQATGTKLSGRVQELASTLSAAGQVARQLAEGADQLKTGTEALSQGVDAYVAGAQSASQGAQQLSSGLDTLASGSATLASGLSAAQAGAASLAQGSQSLAAGAETLGAGVGSAKDGAEELYSGLGSLAAGSAALAGGLQDGADGAQQLAGGLTASVVNIPADTDAQRETRTAVMSSPVSLEESDAHPIPNYGTGFTPYFIPLALWVGALMTYFVVRAVNNRALAGTASDLTVALSGYWPAAAVTAAQAVIMMLVLQFALGLTPTNVALYYLFGVFVSLVFTAIMQFLNVSMGTAGKFLAGVLLMPQLTSAAGTFPLETVPRFFQAINPFLPMTYVVLGLRQAVTLGDVGALGWDVAALLCFGLIAFGATLLTVRRRRVWTMDRLKPATVL